MTRQQLLELRSLLTIAHHIPGRLRLKLDPRIREHPAADVLRRLDTQRQDTGLMDVRINPVARSLVLGYDAGRISPSVLEDFLTSPNMERVNQLADNFAALFGVRLPA